MNARPFDQMKVPEKKKVPEKVPEKVFSTSLRKRMKSSSTDQKVTKVTLKCFFYRKPQKTKFVEKHFTSVSCIVPKKLKVAIYARQTLFFQLRIEGDPLLLQTKIFGSMRDSNPRIPAS